MLFSMMGFKMVHRWISRYSLVFAGFSIVEDTAACLCRRWKKYLPLPSALRMVESPAGFSVWYEALD